MNKKILTTKIAFSVSIGWGGFNGSKWSQVVNGFSFVLTENLSKLNIMIVVRTEPHYTRHLCHINFLKKTSIQNMKTVSN